MKPAEEIPDIIDWSDISQESRNAWIQVSLERDWPNIENVGGWIATDVVAALYFRLSALDDTPERFPKGKWASLQFLHTLIVRELGRK